MKQLFAFLFLVLFSNTTHSQTLHLTISDSVTHERLPYVTVYLKKSGIGTTTDLEGNAKLQLSDNAINPDTLICSYFGYDKRYLPININNVQQLNIKLLPSFQDINEVTIVASKKTFSPKQIVRKALRNTKQNYSNKAVNLLGFYRETFTEDERAIYLNEATVNLYYSKYPQGIFERRDWKDWHYDDRYSFELNYSQFNGFPNQFNSKDDRVQLIEARSTDNWSKYGYRGSIVGGPLSITSKDYPKYQSDFLDTKNFNKYAYKKVGIEKVNGSKCYVIHFYPLESGKKMSISYGKKLNRSIYVGRLYIDQTSFAIVRMEFQLAKNVDFGYYTQFVPLDYRVQINYRKRKEIWTLDKIKLSQLRSYNMRMADHSVLYESTQELFITDVLFDSVKQIPSDTEWKHTRQTSLRDFEVPYHPEYWKEHDTTNYPSLQNFVLEQLTSEKSLAEQFSQRFKQKEDLLPPKAPQKDFLFHYPQEKVSDPYQWFSNPSESTSFYQYIDDETSYAENYMIASRKFQKLFFNSMNQFYPEDTTRREEKFKAGDIILDEDSTGNRVYFEYTSSNSRVAILDLGRFKLSRENCFIDRVKFTQGKVGVRYTNDGGLSNQLIILDKGDLRPKDSIAEIYSFEWLNDSILYYTQNNSLKRSDRLYKRNIQTRTNTLLRTELDLTYDISVSSSKNFLFSTIQSRNESEIYVLSKDGENPQLELLIPRKQDVYNEVREFDGVLYNLTNDKALNNRLLVRKKDEWTELVPHSKGRFIKDFIITKNYIVLNTFHNGLTEISYAPKGSKKWKEIELPTEICEVDLLWSRNDSLSISISSPGLPFTRYLFNLQQEKLYKKQSTKIKRTLDYYPKTIKTERIWVKVKGGTKIPITLSKSTNPKRKHKGLILHVYGSYGSYPGGQGFSAKDLILMKDGFTVAYAHVRGGCILGNQWYNDGKLLNKENTFDDYIACAEHLIKKGYTDSDHLIGYGQSAGGTVIGVAINRRPELFNTVIFDHAYLDVLTTMMNDTLPLTTDHYKEVGNPRDGAYYDYIKNYSPYQNISEQDYPNILLIGGSNDYQTPNWQIAKFAAKLRASNTSQNELLFKTDIGSGHMGSTSGDQWIRDLSFMYGFIYGNLFD
ncbi:MAG: prolyl oligopeptidase family serine peptidase [Crocinitomicaceae bacterium]